MTEQDISDSNADILVRVEPEGYNDGVIYTIYNMTNGTDFCSKQCLISKFQFWLVIFSRILSKKLQVLARNIKIIIAKIQIAIVHTFLD